MRKIEIRHFEAEGAPVINTGIEPTDISDLIPKGYRISEVNNRPELVTVYVKEED